MSRLSISNDIVEPRDVLKSFGTPVDGRKKRWRDEFGTYLSLSRIECVNAMRGSSEDQNTLDHAGSTGREER